jgi:benzoyl-CoA reductase/2-hydroxyglutaryl-CoA dehydratase subunit BcrC/BadD/HgdB
LIDYLAISNSTDVIIRIYLYLREIRRQEPEKPVPPVEFIDWLFTRNRMHQERNEILIRMFRQTVEQWAGRTITDEEIRNAAAICNEDRDALRAMSALRRCEQPCINGSEALVIIGSSFFMDRSEHAKLVRTLVEDAKNWPVLTGHRIFVTGSNQESTEFYDMIEAAGGVVVGEDHDWGERHYDRDTNLMLDPIRGIVDRYMLREFSSKKAFVSQRVESLNRCVNAAGANGVVFFMNIFEEAASWDYPEQKKSLEKRSIDTAAFVKQQYPISKNEGLEDELIAFIQRMKGGKA